MCKMKQALCNHFPVYISKNVLLNLLKYFFTIKCHRH